MWIEEGDKNSCFFIKGHFEVLKNSIWSIKSKSRKHLTYQKDIEVEAKKYFSNLYLFRAQAPFFKKLVVCELFPTLTNMEDNIQMECPITQE